MISSNNLIKNETTFVLIKSLKITYFIISLLIIITLFLFLIFPNDFLLKITPICEWKMKYGKECFFCGMTRAFISIKNLNFSEALRLNSFSIAFFIIIITNEIISSLFLIKLYRKFYANF